MLPKKIKKFISLALLFALFSFSFASAETYEMKTSPKYLIILVHGLNDTSYVYMGKGQHGSDISDIPDGLNEYEWGDLKGYLENDLGLKGYVYAYTFSERDGRIALEGQELGDRSHHNKASEIGGTLHYKTGSNVEIDKWHTGIKEGNCWLEQARKDFIEWFKDPKKNPNNPSGRSPTEEEMPDKYILISHSLGGMATRAYISSDYYQNDVEKIITIDAQHKGSNAAEALKRLDEFYDSGEWKTQYMAMLGATYTLALMDQKELATYTGISALLIPIARVIVDNLFTRSFLGWYSRQPAVQDINFNSGFVKNINSKSFVKGDQPIKARFLCGRGIPTPSENLPLIRYVLGPEVIQAILSSSEISDLPLSGQIMAIYLSIALGAIVNQDGDIYANKRSQLGEGIKGLKASNVDYKTFVKSFGSSQIFMGDNLVLEEIVGGIFSTMAAAELVQLVIGNNSIVVGMIRFGIIIGCGAAAAVAFQPVLDNYLSGHGLALKMAVDEHTIDKALEDIPIVGGNNITTTEAEGSIKFKTASITTKGVKTLSFDQLTSPPPQYQTFALLSDYDMSDVTKREKPRTGKYHLVNILDYTAYDKNPGNNLAPIIVDGKKLWIYSLTVKEAPTKIKGVINTFLPKKLKSFQYSENFAAWKDIGSVDEWGNFNVDDLKLAEGQNLVAFRAENIAGFKSNQVLKIILNTIPMWASHFLPAQGFHTNNPNQRMRIEFHKSCYTDDPSEGIDITDFILDGEPVAATITKHQGIYEASAEAEYVPQTPLADGEHHILVRAKSNVGVTQAIWSFIVDTAPPGIIIEPVKPFSPGKSGAQ